jgi:hypothetical protein
MSANFTRSAVYFRPSYLVGVCAKRNTESASETEVGELEVEVLVDEEVLGLEVAMQDAVGMAVSHTLAELHHELLDHGVVHVECFSIQTCALGQGFAAAALADRQRLHVLLQVTVKELKDEVELVAVGVDDVEQAHNVGIVHLLEQRNLADGRGRDALILGFEPDLLEGEDALVLCRQVLCLVDDAVSA